ncbi:hypothetical protein [Phormidium sp. CCY1219]|uniref:hypothetical protein n=1 Tax=Phormidium sp. CCY1219 TaxID=2886104 RepID=UPI003FA6B97C
MMRISRSRQIILSGLLALLLLVGGCTQPQQTSRWEGAQQESTQVARNRTSAGESVAGGQFNKFFPSAAGEYQRVYAQEKRGFAEAKLKRGGKEVAMLSISDTANNPNAVRKFQNSTQTIGGYPAVSVGSKGTAVLVGDRFQVKVQSRDPSFSASDREAWLQKFNLNGLRQLK